MANYKLKYAGEKIDELLTKIDNLGAGTDAKSGTVKLSSATDSNSGVSDGVAATPSAVSQLKADMDTKANKTDVLSLEEIQASTDLSGKIASASSVKEISTKVAGIDSVVNIGYSGESNEVSFIPRNMGYGVYVVFGLGGKNIIGLLSISDGRYRIIYQGDILISTSGSVDDTVDIDVGSWYVYLRARRIA